MQSYRHDSLDRVFLWAVRKIVDLMEVELQGADRPSQLAASVAELGFKVDGLLAETEPSGALVRQLIPGTQALVRRFIESHAARVYIFLDDFHYLPRQDQPYLLDMIHGIVRDTDAWDENRVLHQASHSLVPDPSASRPTDHARC